MVGGGSIGGMLAGDRGRLLVGLLFAEFGTAVQTVAENAVLPLASRELHGAALYGGTVAAPTLSAIAFTVLGPTLTARLGPRGTLGWSTVVYVAGTLLAVLAPGMGVLLAGRLLQGAATGLLAGFGLNAVGALYEDDIRPRVLALFSVMWLLPSVVGPVLNGLVAALGGWRWAIGWPALVVVAARIVIGRRSALLPPVERPRRPPLGTSATVLAGLVLATVAPDLPSAFRVPVWSAGLLLAAIGGALVIRGLTGGSGRRMLVLGVLAGFEVAFFGGEGLLSLGVIDVTGGDVWSASLAYAAGSIGWSLLALRPASAAVRPVAALLGTVGLVAGAAILAAVTLSAATGPAALVVAVLAWAPAGVGMGLAFPVLTAGAMDAAEAADLPSISAGVAFTETAGTAFAGLVGSGFYSATHAALPPSAGIGGGYLLTTGVAVATVLAALALTRLNLRARTAAAV